MANIRRILKKKAVFDCLHSKEVDVYDWTREELMSKKNSPLRKPKPIRSSEKKESIVSETLTPLQTYQCAYLSYPISVTRSRYSKEKIVSPKKVNLRLAVPSKLYRADIVAEHWKTDYGFAPLSAPGKRLQLPINFIRNMDRKRMDKSK